MDQRQMETTLPLAVVGCDFRVASSAWRSALVLDPEERLRMARSLIGSKQADGIAFLDTCNRNEWIVSADQPNWTVQLLEAQMIGRWQKNRFSNTPKPYRYVGLEAVEHILRVAVGLESFVTGEAQIAGQLNASIEQARRNGTGSTILNGLGRTVGRVTREAFRAGIQGGLRRGVHGLTLDYLVERFRDELKTVAVVGMGQIGRKTAALLESHTPYKLIRVNRTVWADTHAIVPLSRIEEVVEEADALVLATGALKPLFSMEEIARWKGKGKLELLDLGIPAQIGGTDENRWNRLHYDGLDRLFTAKSKKMDEPSEEKALEIVRQGIEEFSAFCAERPLAPLLEDAQSRHERYIHDKIPDFIEQILPEFDLTRRRQVERDLRGFIREYTNEVIEAIHREANARVQRK